MIQNNFIDMENMFELLDQPKDVADKPDAPEINVSYSIFRIGLNQCSSE